MEGWHRHRSRIQSQICPQKLFHGREYRDAVTLFGFDRAARVGLYSRNQLHPGVGVFQLAIDTEVIAPKRPRPRHRDTQPGSAILGTVVYFAPLPSTALRQRP